MPLPAPRRCAAAPTPAQRLRRTRREGERHHDPRITSSQHRRVAGLLAEPTAEA